MKRKKTTEKRGRKRVVVDSTKRIFLRAGEKKQEGSRNWSTERREKFFNQKRACRSGSPRPQYRNRVSVGTNQSLPPLESVVCRTSQRRSAGGITKSLYSYSPLARRSREVPRRGVVLIGGVLVRGREKTSSTQITRRNRVTVTTPRVQFVVAEVCGLAFRNRQKLENIVVPRYLTGAGRR